MSSTLDQQRPRSDDSTTRDAASGNHEITLGGEVAGNRLKHDQFTQPALFDADRNASPMQAAAEEHEASLRGRTMRFSLFAADILTLSPRTQLTPSLRWNWVRVDNTLGQPSPGTHESFRYSKANPALGGTYVLSDGLVLFGNAAQGIAFLPPWSWVAPIPRSPACCPRACRPIRFSSRS